MKPPRARMGFPALGWIPGHTGCGHLLYNTNDADAEALSGERVKTRKKIVVRMKNIEAIVRVMSVLVRKLVGFIE